VAYSIPTSTVVWNQNKPAYAQTGMPGVSTSMWNTMIQKPWVSMMTPTTARKKKAGGDYSSFDPESAPSGGQMIHAPGYQNWLMGDLEEMRGTQMSLNRANARIFPFRNIQNPFQLTPLTAGGGQLPPWGLRGMGYWNMRRV